MKEKKIYEKASWILRNLGVKNGYYMDYIDMRGGYPHIKIDIKYMEINIYHKKKLESQKCSWSLVIYFQDRNYLLPITPDLPDPFGVVYEGYYEDHFETIQHVLRRIRKIQRCMK